MNKKIIIILSCILVIGGIGIYVYSNMNFEDELIIKGCNDPNSCNYNSEVTIYVEGSCIYKDCGGSCNNEYVQLFDDCYNILETTELDLDSLSGQIPPSIGKLTNLIYLDLDYNQLSGEIPPELGNLTNLIKLELNDNQLSGEIPPELGNLTNLELLDLYGNQLSGEIPPELGNLTNLEYLRLHDNQLTGEIPPEIGNLTNLTKLYLNNNQLSGEIPYTLYENFLNKFGHGKLSGNNLIPNKKRNHFPYDRHGRIFWPQEIGLHHDYFYKTDEGIFFITVLDDKWYSEKIVYSGFGEVYDFKNSSTDWGIIKDKILYDKTGYIRVGDLLLSGEPCGSCLHYLDMTLLKP